MTRPDIFVTHLPPSSGGKKKVLIFCDYYRPSTKSGGGMWTVVNLVERFRDRYDFFVVTRNHDKGSTSPYPAINSDQWNVSASDVPVYYSTPANLSPTLAAGLATDVGPDIVFLNSIFSTSGIAYLRARRKESDVGDTPTIVAPCGELSRAAMRSKTLKKKLFLNYAKAIGLYRNVIWKASSDLEQDEIKGVFGAEADPIIAPDLSPKTILPDFSASMKPEKIPGEAQFAFFSRVVPKKNLTYFLDRLAAIGEGRITLSIVGPLEDHEYWQRCESKIERLSSNVEVRTVGAVSYLEGLKLLCENHFFVLPTLNENFGYVILESLAAGTPVLLSENTIWGHVETHGAGWILPLDDPDRWIEQIRKCLAMTNDEYQSVSGSARKFALAYLAQAKDELATAKLLEHAVNRGRYRGI